MARGHWRFRKRPGRGLICTQQRQETLSLVGACGVSQDKGVEVQVIGYVQSQVRLDM